MSNFLCRVKIKETGEIKNAAALDNYFGHHNYGYDVDGVLYKEDEVEVILNS